MADPNPAPTPQPLGLPPGVKFEKLPRALQEAYWEFIHPAYLELVVNAPNALSKINGGVVIYAHWLALLEQYQIGRQILSKDLTWEHNKDLLDHHLRLLSLTEKYGKTLAFIHQHYHP